MKILILMFLAFHFNLFAKDMHFIGFVVDQKNSTPVYNAKIELYQSPKKIYQTTTDSTGKFEFLFTEKFYDVYILVSKDGYKALKERIILAYDSNFTFKLEPKEYQLQGLVIIKTKKTPLQQLHNYDNILEGKELQKNMSSTLGLTLKNTTDIFVRFMGPATSKPVFRGLSLEYLGIFENNFPVKDLSSTAPDHSIAVNPVAYDKIELLRGPKLLIFTNNALGGLINLTSRDYLTEEVPVTSVNFSTIYESAFDSKIYNLKWEIPVKNLFTSGSMGLKNSHDMQSGKGLVQNTYFSSKSGNLNIGFKNTKLSACAEGSFFDFTYGVPGGFVGAHPKGVDITLERNSFNIRTLIHLHKFVDNVSFYLSRSYYHHVEMEKNGTIGAEFLLRNYYFKTHLNFNKTNNFNESIFGIAFENSTNDYGGYVFTPSVNSYLLSTFIYQNIRFGNNFIDYSLRYDHKEYNPVNINNTRQNRPVKRIFNNVSFSVLVMHSLGQNLHLGLNFGRNERFPTIEELYSNGPHLAAYSFEIGNSQLETEVAYFAELSQSVSLKNIDVSSSLFWYEFPNYLFPQNIGKINVAQLLPIYQISSIKARLFGFSFRGLIDITSNTSLTIELTFNHGIDRTNARYLPMIPPTKGSIEINKKFGNLEITLKNTFAFS
ncbi:MAG: TonB-dependent receptor domain-containing protein, partial [Candidatus Kapaibacteriota bacterium]